METFKGILFLIEAIIGIILATIITVVLKFAGIFYGFGWLVYNYKHPKKIGIFIDTWIGGVIQNLAWLIMQISLYLDYNWNIGGSSELMEDYTTYDEDSFFNKPRVSISAAIGHSEIQEKTTKHVRGFSRLLNKVFREDTHAKSSYRKYLIDKEFNMEEFQNEDRLL